MKELKVDMERIDEAKRFLGIEDYPGNLFDLFSDVKKTIVEKRVLLFKEDIDKLSGFIGYSSGYAIICINYRRNIGHQNFTLAHELGHKFLHIGMSTSDSNPESNKKDRKEREANEFAKELLYPKHCVNEDVVYVLEKKLLLEENWSELAEYINQLCCKYYTSYTFTSQRLLEDVIEDYADRNLFYRQFKKNEVGKFDDRFPETAYMYNVKDGYEFYKADYKPYSYMKELVSSLVNDCELGLETGEAMIERYKELEG